MHALILSRRCAGCGWPCGERADLLLKMYNEGMKCYPLRTRASVRTRSFLFRLPLRASPRRTSEGGA